MMQTRCPACGTVFRVTPEQLKARHGKVRCGKCQHVFDALETLLDAPPAKTEEAWPKTVPMPYDETAPDSVPDTVPEAELAAAEAASATAAMTADDQGYAALDEAATATTKPTAEPEPVAPAAAEPPGEATPEAMPAPTTSPPKPIEPLLHEEELEPGTPRRRAWPWLLASLLALLLLGLQAIVQFRVELAVLAPEAKPTLQALCGMLDCDVPLPRKADQLSIEISDLHPDPRNKGQLILAATLKNRAPFAQTLPHLELTLTDTVDQPMLRKIIAPIEYLPKGTDLASGFAAGGEVAVSLALIPENAGKAAAAGYRLYLFYP